MTIIKLNGKNFEAEALQAKEPVLVDFWAEWCGPCRMLSPLVDEIANELTDKVKIGKVNVDEEPELAKTYGVMSIPTLVVLKEGKVAASSVGVKPKAEILKLLEI
jgi:thioredoxin 1